MLEHSNIIKEREKKIIMKEESNNYVDSVIDIETVLQYKIVYWGPGESGKTTNYKVIKKKLNHLKISRGISVETTDHRTLLNDQVTIYFSEGDIGFYIDIITCTGQERFLQTREYVLDGADGVIFVADSSIEKIEQNKRSFREIKAFTNKNKIPYIIQLNKRDLKDAISIEQFKKYLNLPTIEKYEDGTMVIYPAIATEGKNVMECFNDIILRMYSNSFNI